MKNPPTYIYGMHPVSEALARAPHALRHLYLVSGHDTKRFVQEARNHNIPLDRCDEAHMPRGVDRDAVHQGVVAAIAPEKVLIPYKDFIQDLSVSEHTALVLVDELTDPHNVGAIIRSAAAFGIAGVLIPEHRQAQVTGTVVKVSAGMAFVVPLVQVGNVNTAVRALKNKGFWVYGLTGDGDTLLTDEQFTRPTIFIFGNEAKGLREKTEELCDFRLRIPIEKDCESLNAAACAAVTFYAWKSQHGVERT